MKDPLIPPWIMMHTTYPIHRIWMPLMTRLCVCVRVCVCVCACVRAFEIWVYTMVVRGQQLCEKHIVTGFKKQKSYQLKRKNTIFVQGCVCVCMCAWKEGRE